MKVFFSHRISTNNPIELLFNPYNSPYGIYAYNTVFGGPGLPLMCIAGLVCCAAGGDVPVGGWGG